MASSRLFILYGKDLEQAKFWLEKAALGGQANSDEAQFFLGTLYTDYHTEHFDHMPVDYEKALYWLNKASKKDHARAQFFISQLYYTGRGETIPQDYLRCAYWLKKSAIGGYESSQYLLGLMFMQGEGIDQDREQGFYWIKKAAQHGMSQAEYKLALCYIDGIGTNKDYRRLEHLCKVMSHDRLTMLLYYSISPNRHLHDFYIKIFAIFRDCGILNYRRTTK
ncbi:conserved hypothetical protein (plasmid) [Candidatus Protochlamydia naegleriophila]|uniref:Sel1 repeat family protein n=1 Tax=Candidatus Protochlamydia naegleriophila TaxID=389348 RepID=A0A0U5JJF6_9BACT|nr:tetratricopeptide repeat protein [Candidatus Protochlamydia naegleriophila]CUI18133.1 conserved hypothetical protein [Candidatus Protochlamydia naegleriophila]